MPTTTNADWGLQPPSQHSWIVGVDTTGLIIPIGGLVGVNPVALPATGKLGTNATMVSLQVGALRTGPTDANIITTSEWFVCSKISTLPFLPADIKLPTLQSATGGPLPVLSDAATFVDVATAFAAANDNILPQGQWYPLCLTPGTILGLRLVMEPVVVGAVAEVLISMFQTAQS